jgi:hypothetical protein
MLKVNCKKELLRKNYYITDNYIITQHEDAFQGVCQGGQKQFDFFGAL